MATRYTTDGKLTEDEAGLLVRFEDYASLEQANTLLARQIEQDTAAHRSALEAAEARHALRVEGLEQRIADLETLAGDRDQEIGALKADVDKLSVENAAVEQDVIKLERGIVLAQEALEAALPKPQPTPAETLLEQIRGLVAAREASGSRSP